MTRDDEIVRLREQLAVSESLREAQVKELSGKLIECLEAMCEDGNEIARLERILAALREPSEAVMISAENAMDTASATDCVPGDWNTAWVLEAIRAAVAAAEKETSTETSHD